MKDREPYADEHRRALEHLASLTPEEQEEHLRRAGILDEDGRVSDKLQRGGEPVGVQDTDRR